ncbi:unnamed protein product, partial [Prorocentrum cordatum]
DAAVAVTRALGCADLKSPLPLLATGVATSVVELRPGEHGALVLLSDGAASLAEAEVAAVIQRHQGRPRAAALQLTQDAAAARGEGAEPSGDAVAAVCAFMNFRGGSPAPPDPKRAKTAHGAAQDIVKFMEGVLAEAREDVEETSAHGKKFAERGGA